MGEGARCRCLGGSIRSYHALAGAECLEGDDGVGVLDAGNDLHLLIDEMANISVVVDVELHQEVVITRGRIDLGGDLGLGKRVGDGVGLAELAFELHEKRHHRCHLRSRRRGPIEQKTGRRGKRTCRGWQVALPRDIRPFGAETAASRMMTTPIALTIAGSDSSGGAGIQADLKTFAAFGVYGASVITALTAQNTSGVSAVHQVPADFVTAQIDAVFADLDVKAVKIGMVGQLAAIEAIANGLK